jgi:hypothetical protein
VVVTRRREDISSRWLRGVLEVAGASPSARSQHTGASPLNGGPALAPAASQARAAAQRWHPLTARLPLSRFTAPLHSAATTSAAAASRSRARSLAKGRGRSCDKCSLEGCSAHCVASPPPCAGGAHQERDERCVAAAHAHHKRALARLRRRKQRQKRKRDAPVFSGARNSHRNAPCLRSRRSRCQAWRQAQRQRASLRCA